MQEFFAAASCRRMSDKEKAAAAASRAAQFKNKGKTEDEMRRRRNEVKMVSFLSCNLHLSGDSGDQENKEGRYLE